MIIGGWSRSLVNSILYFFDAQSCTYVLYNCTYVLYNCMHVLYNCMYVCMHDIMCVLFFCFQFKLDGKKLTSSEKKVTSLLGLATYVRNPLPFSLNSI